MHRGTGSARSAVAARCTRVSTPHVARCRLGLRSVALRTRGWRANVPPPARAASLASRARAGPAAGSIHRPVSVTQSACLPSDGPAARGSRALPAMRRSTLRGHGLLQAPRSGRAHSSCERVRCACGPFLPSPPMRHRAAPWAARGVGPLAVRGRARRGGSGAAPWPTAPSRSDSARAAAPDLGRALDRGGGCARAQYERPRRARGVLLSSKGARVRCVCCSAARE